MILKKSFRWLLRVLMQMRQKLTAMFLSKYIDKSQIKAGDLLEVEITDADEYDLFAKLIRIKSA